MHARRAIPLILSAILGVRAAAGQGGLPVIAADDGQADAGASATVAVRTRAPLLVGSSDVVLQFDARVLEVTAVASVLESFSYGVNTSLGTVTTASATGGAGEALAAGDPLFLVTIRVPANAAPGCTPLTIGDADGVLPDDLAGPLPPIPPPSVPYATAAARFCVTSCRSCDDGDGCTTDTCDAGSSQCQHADASPTVPAGLACNVANIRRTMGEPPVPVCRRRCPPAVDRLLARVDERLAAATSATDAPACLTAVRALSRTSRALRRRIAGLARQGKFLPAERGTRLAAEARRLADRARTFSHSHCTARTS